MCASVACAATGGDTRDGGIAGTLAKPDLASPAEGAVAKPACAGPDDGTDASLNPARIGAAATVAKPHCIVAAGVVDDAVGRACASGAHAASDARSEIANAGEIENRDRRSFDM